MFLSPAPESSLRYFRAVPPPKVDEQADTLRTVPSVRGAVATLF